MSQIHPSLTQLSDKFEAVMLERDGQEPVVLWHPVCKAGGEPFFALAVAWMNMDSTKVRAFTLRERTVWCKYDRRMLTVWDRVGKAWDATKQVHPTVIAQMLQVRQQYLSR